MSNSQQDLADRLKQSREAAGYGSPTDAARAMGMEPPTYLGHENGSRGFTANAQRYSDFFKASLEWLLTGRGAMKKTDADDLKQVRHVPKAPDSDNQVINIQQWPRDVPILGGAVCGEDDLFELNGQINDHARRPPRLVGVKGIYALYVQGTSMSPWREPGQMVYVHPHQPVKIGDYVVVQMVSDEGDGASKAYIKRLVRRTADKLVLQQYDPNEQKTLPMKKVKSIHRIVDWSELVGF